MPSYSLTVADDRRILSAQASDREEALAKFGKELNKRLTLNDQGTVANHLMDEWTESPHG